MSDTTTACKPGCGCQARTPREAVVSTSRFIGVDEDKATALLYLLREYGWELTRQEASR